MSGMGLACGVRFAFLSLSDSSCWFLLSNEKRSSTAIGFSKTKSITHGSGIYQVLGGMITNQLQGGN